MEKQIKNYEEYSTQITINDQTWNLFIEFWENDATKDMVWDEDDLLEIHYGFHRLIKSFGIPRIGEMIDIDGWNEIWNIIYDIKNNEIAILMKW